MDSIFTGKFLIYSSLLVAETTISSICRVLSLAITGVAKQIEKAACPRAITGVEKRLFIFI